MSFTEGRHMGRRCTIYLTDTPVGEKRHFIQMRHFQCVCVCTRTRTCAWGIVEVVQDNKYYEGEGTFP